jgi:hypothetical protein
MKTLPSQKTFTVMARGDSIPELDIPYRLRLVSAPGDGSAVIGLRNQTRITVLANDDPYGVFRFQDSSPRQILESKELNHSAQFVVLRNAGIFGQVTVDYHVRSASQDPIKDVHPTTGTITYMDGEVSHELSLQSVADDIPEDDEGFTVVLSNPTAGASLDDDASTLTAPFVISKNDDDISFEPPVEVNFAIRQTKY